MREVRRLRIVVVGLLMAMPFFLPPPEVRAEEAAPENPPAEATPVGEEPQPDTAAASQEPESNLELKEDGLHFLKYFRLNGNLQFWWRAYEGAENDRHQLLTLDRASEMASGFSFRQVRLALSFETQYVEVRAELGLETGPQLLDAYAVLNLWRTYIQLRAGQMKIPSTYEAMLPSTDLDFASMSVFSELSPNWALSKHASLTSPFQGVRTFGRDMGVALLGSYRSFDYLLMVGNGLGANLGIGASESKQYVYSNDVGAYFYGGRLSVDFARMFPEVFAKAYCETLSFGGQVSYNRHPNLLFTDQRTVLDLERFSWSVDATLAVTPYVRVTGLFGEGRIDDDFDNDQKRDYRYRGWEAKLMVAPIPDTLELGFRADAYIQEYAENHHPETLMSYSFGISYRFWQYLRVDANYKMKRLESYTNPDIKDDLVLLQLQAKI